MRHLRHATKRPLQAKVVLWYAFGSRLGLERRFCLAEWATLGAEPSVAGSVSGDACAWRVNPHLQKPR